MRLYTIVRSHALIVVHDGHLKSLIEIMSFFRLVEFNIQPHIVYIYQKQNIGESTSVLPLASTGLG